jgi:hypothetical protein
MSTRRYMQAGVPQCSVLSPTLYSLYINDTPQIPVWTLFADATCLYATDHKECCVLRNIRRGLDSMEVWCKRWNIKINEDKTRAICFTRRNCPPDSLLKLNKRNIPFVNSIKYLGVLFDKRMEWSLHIQMIEAKIFRTFIRTYSLLNSKRLSANIKLTICKAPIRSVLTNACSAWELAAECHLLKLQILQDEVLRKFPRRTSVRDIHKAFHIPYVYDYITKSCMRHAEVIQDHEDDNVR